MLKKRIIGVVTVKNGYAVQSIGYKRYLPLGHPSNIVENLNRWGVDEILIQSIDRSKLNLGPDLDLIADIAESAIGTPVIYSGGIHTKRCAIDVIHAGADRITVDAILHDKPSVARDIADVLGSQALIGALPLLDYENEIGWYDYLHKNVKKISSEVITLFDERIFSEALLLDVKNEGSFCSFDERITELLTISIPKIIFGGISELEQIHKYLQRDDISAIAIGNFLNYREHAVQNIKLHLPGLSLRKPVFQSITK